MTVGIYKLNFSGTNMVYIGQSIDIEERFKKHLSNLRRQLSPTKLQNAYNTYGIPTMEILIECSVEELDTVEDEAVTIFDSVNNGFNTMYNHGYRSCLYGDTCGNSKYSNEQIIKVFKLLIEGPELTQIAISEMTGVSKSVVNDISRLSTHSWLEKVFPEEYIYLRKNFNTRRFNRRTAKSRDIHYPNIISPNGISYTVDSVRGFAREHGLNPHALGRLLRGDAKSHAGWTREKILGCL